MILGYRRAGLVHDCSFYACGIVVLVAFLVFRKFDLAMLLGILCTVPSVVVRFVTRQYVRATLHACAVVLVVALGLLSLHLDSTATDVPIWSPPAQQNGSGAAAPAR